GTRQARRRNETESSPNYETGLQTQNETTREALMTYAFYILAFLAVSAAAGVLLTRQLFHGALMLLISLLCIAGLYVVSMAELVAIMPSLVYAGGVVVIISFGIMLTTRISGKRLEVTNKKWFAGILVGISLMTLLISLVTRENFGATGVFDPNPHFTI